MALRFYNTLSRSEVDFRPLDTAGRVVSLYCCGPTVYHYAHIGNFRTFIFEDLLRRHLEIRGYEVRHVMNITDVEDKIIRTIRENGESLKIFTRRYEDFFLEDLFSLGCLRPKIMPRATEHVEGMIALIEELMKKGMAYATDDGSVYFNVEKFPSYGKLSRLDRTQLKPGARVRQDEHSREAYGDFALWKGYSECDGEVFWESPWGKGRPGWHIECSCMSMKHLGETIDIHCGGEDLIFPHHEDEIAQSEGVTGKTFARFWLHSAHLLVDGQKMSKSLGNFFTLRDLMAKGFTGREIRYALVSVHYRLPLNFTFKNLEGARQTLHRLDAWVKRLRSVTGISPNPAEEGNLFRDFTAALDEDLNISGALAHLFKALRESNRRMDLGEFTSQEAAQLLRDWERVEQILGLPKIVEESASEEILAIARERDACRQEKNWKKSDELRDKLRARGWRVEDTATGFKLVRN